MSETTPLLEIKNLHVSAGDTEILKGVDLVVNQGEIQALMGPNGSGKSSLAATLMGHPSFKITEGTILYKGEDITGMSATNRGKLGMFLAFQHPEEIPGVSVLQFLRQALSNRTGTNLTVMELRLKVTDAMKELGMESSFADRYLNEGFSGGERKRNEVLQMAVLEPELAILDETDSGLDIDALRTVAEGVMKLTGPERGFLIITHYQRLLDYITPDVVHIFMDGRILESGGPERGFLIITHYQRLLDYITPDVVHIFMDGRILESGGPELAKKLEEDGYDSFRTALTQK